MRLRPRAPVAVALSWRDPVQAFAPLNEEPYAMLLGPGQAGAEARWSLLMARPESVYEASGDAALSNLPALPNASGGPSLPFLGGYAGLASYELGASLDRVPRLKGSNWPDLAFGYYPCAAIFDHQNCRLFAVGPDRQKALAFARLLGENPPGKPAKAKAAKLHFQHTRNDIEMAVAKVRDLINAGDIFQANISQDFYIKMDSKDDAFSCFRRLARLSPAPFGGFFRRTANQALLSNSPERFFCINTGGLVQTSPIKGTRPRHADPKRDQALAVELERSGKDRAENLMIVDLMRNDLSRVCIPGSVRVSALCALRSFANVHHLVSTIEGQLPAGKNALDLLAASFPPGSVTGAPKVQAMHIIAQMEDRARGPYCGALGYISIHGAADFNVLIRSAEYTRTRNGQHLKFSAGGGIVADSDPALEYDEMLDKARALCAAAGAPL